MTYWDGKTRPITKEYAEGYDRIFKKKKKKQDHDFPLAVGLWANKYDLWKDKYNHQGKIEDHPIFESFKPGLQRLNDAGIPCHKYIVSAKSDSEMVYRGVLTMIKDY